MSFIRSDLPIHPLGRTGLSVSILGLGGGQIGHASISEPDAGRFLNEALDLGVTLIDTARAYGLSEERIGRHLSHRRGEFVLSTKVGYGISWEADWSRSCVAAGVDEALKRLRTDRIDIVHLHSCPLEVLRDGSAVDALEEARRAGKIRVAAYSGEGDALEFAVACGRFQSIQTSVNFCDQRGLDQAVKAASQKGLGVIAKRPLANAPWRFQDRPAGHYAEEYWRRWKAMGVDPRGLDWGELAIRFAAYQPGVDICIAGTSDIGHLRENIRHVAKGPLPDDLAMEMRQAFKAHARDWVGQV